jgi:hypothetical protein
MRQSRQARHRRVNDLAAKSVATGSPAIGEPAFGQLHSLTAVDLAVGEAPPCGETLQEVGFEKILIKIIAASPDRRTKSKHELLELGTTQFGLSRRRAKALRECVIRKLGARAWSKAGARRHDQS